MTTTSLPELNRELNREVLSLLSSLSVYIRLIATRKHAFTDAAEQVLHETFDYVQEHVSLLNTDLRTHLVMLIVMHDKLLTHMPHVKLTPLSPLVSAAVTI